MGTNVANAVTLADPPAIGSRVFTVGSPIEGLLLSKGTLSSIFRNLTEEWLVLDIPADHGSSGGPVFSDEGLIGLVISKDRKNGDIYAYTSAEIQKDYDLVMDIDNGRTDFPLPMGVSNVDLLVPTLVSSSMTFLLGLGLGILATRLRRKEKQRPRIRIEV